MGHGPNIKAANAENKHTTKNTVLISVKILKENGSLFFSNGP